MPPNTFDFSQLSPEPDKVDGVWTRCFVTLRDGTKVDTGVDLLIAYGVDNAAFTERQAVLGRRLQQLAKSQPVPANRLALAVRQAMAGTVLKDWRGYTLDGKDVPYSRDAAEAALLRHVQFSDFVEGFAAEIKNFRSEEALSTPPTAVRDVHDPALLTQDSKADSLPEAEGDGEEVDHSPEGALKSDGPVVGGVPGPASAT